MSITDFVDTVIEEFKDEIDDGLLGYINIEYDKRFYWYYYKWTITIVYKNARVQLLFEKAFKELYGNSKVCKWTSLGDRKEGNGKYSLWKDMRSKKDYRDLREQMVECIRDVFKVIDFLLIEVENIPYKISNMSDDELYDALQKANINNR